MMLATIVQMPDLREVSSVISTLQSQETRPRNPLLHSPSSLFLPLKPASSAKTEAVGTNAKVEIRVKIIKSFLNRVFILDKFL